MLIELLGRRRRRKALYIRDIDINASALRSLLLLAGIFFLHTLCMMWFEDLPFSDSLWLTLTTATTVGYGDYSATTFAGRAATVVLLYFGGIFVLANFAGEYFEGRVERKNRMLKGDWEWNMSGHIVIINTPIAGGTAYFIRLIDQLRKVSEFAQTPIQILTRQYPEGLPKELRELGVVHHTGYPDKKDSLEAINIREADVVILLAKDEDDVTSDALNFDILHRIQEAQVRHATIIAECVDDENRERFLKVGADIVIRPVRAYPEIIVRTLVAPGSEKILENLFMHDGDHTRRYNLHVNNLSWGEVVNRIVNAGFGTPLAYINNDDDAVCNADPAQNIDAVALIIMVRSSRVPTSEKIAEILR
jgi:voltage-gated potassium channel